MTRSHFIKLVLLSPFASLFGKKGADACAVKDAAEGIPGATSPLGARRIVYVGEDPFHYTWGTPLHVTREIYEDAETAQESINGYMLAQLK